MKKLLQHTSQSNFIISYFGQLNAITYFSVRAETATTKLKIQYPMYLSLNTLISSDNSLHPIPLKAPAGDPDPGK